MISLRTLALAGALLSGASPALLAIPAELAVGSQGWGELRRDLSVSGKALSVAGTRYAKGFGTHAHAELPVPVPARATALSGKVGVDDGAGAGNGSVTFRILSGDTVLWESPVMKAGDAAVAFHVPVSGALHRRLYLQVDGMGANAYDHANWLELRWTEGAPAAAQPARTFTGEQFGIRADDTNDQTPAFRRALAALRQAPGSTLKLAPGTYHFRAAGAQKRHFHISNHEQPDWHPVSLPLVDLRDVTIDGADATFLFHGIVHPVLIMDSERVTLRGVRCDYAIPHHSQGRVEATGPGFYEVSVDADAYPHALRGDRLVFRGEGWEQRDGGWGIIFDGKTGAIVTGTSDFDYSGKMTQVAPGRYRVARDIARAGVKVGDVITFRQALWTSRPHPTVTLYRAKDTVLENCVIHAANGMGLLAQRSENITFSGGGVYPRAGTGRVFTTNADATHFSNTKGRILVENALFTGMMDDAINVHATCLRIVARPAANTIRCRFMHPQAVGFEIALPGEALRFIHARTLTDGEARRIVAVRRLSVDEVEYVFDREIPADVIVGDAVENADWHPEVIFRGNTVKHNRARGSLFTTNRPVVVENNRFENIAGSAILLAGDANGWFESGACRDVLIRGNTFVNNLTSRFQFTEAIIVAYPEVPDLAGQKRRYHANVRILDNVFETFDVPLVYAISTDGLTFKGNRVNYNADFPAWKKPPFIFKGCERVVIEDNVVTNPPAGQVWPK